MLYKFAELFSQLLLGLLAVLVPIFALMSSLLARAIEDGRRKLEEDIQGIYRDIQEVRKQESGDPEIAINELKKAIRRYSWLQRKARLRRFLLSTWASVYCPGLLFLASLLLLVPVLSSGAQPTNLDCRLVITAVSLSLVSTGILCGVIQTLYRYASTYEPPQLVEPDLPEKLEVRFLSGASVVVWPAGTKQPFQVLVSNGGDYLAERILVSARFQPEFGVEGKGGIKIAKQPDNSKLALWEVGSVHAHVSTHLAPLQITLPTTKGEYPVTLRLRAARIKMLESQMKIVVG